MTYLFSDGLDAQGDLPDRWSIRQPEATFGGAATGKFGGDSLLITGIAGGGAALISTTFPEPAAPRGSTANPAHCSFYFKSAVTPSSDRVMAVFRDDQNGAFMSIIGNDTGGISVGQLSSIVSQLSPTTSPRGSVFDDLWHHIEVKVIVSATVGLVHIYVDNVKVADFSGDTISIGALGTEGFSSFSVDSPTTSCSFDDIFVWDEEGTNFAVTTQFGAHRLATIIPDGIGATTDFTVTGAANNFQAVDEAISDEDTTYVESGTIDDKDTYTYTAMPIGIDTIHGVAIHTRSKNDDIGLITAAIVARSGVVESNGPTFSVSSAGIYAGNTTFYPLDPDGSAAWTETRVNAAEFGIKVIA